MQPDYHFDQQVKLHPQFTDYTLNEQSEKQHEAGYDAMMTGTVWFKFNSLLYNPIKKEFPGVAAILSNNFIEVCDKNKIPMASIRQSLDLAKP
jgi:hypothetical protein